LTFGAKRTNLKVRLYEIKPPKEKSKVLTIRSSIIDSKVALAKHSERETQKEEAI